MFYSFTLTNSQVPCSWHKPQTAIALLHYTIKGIQNSLSYKNWRIPISLFLLFTQNSSRKSQAWQHQVLSSLYLIKECTSRGNRNFDLINTHDSLKQTLKLVVGISFFKFYYLQIRVIWKLSTHNYFIEHFFKILTNLISTKVLISNLYLLNVISDLYSEVVKVILWCNQIKFQP